VLVTSVRGRTHCKDAWNTNIDGKKYPQPITVDPLFFFILRDLKGNGNYGFLCEADRSTLRLDFTLERYTRYTLMFIDEADIQKYKM